MNPSTIICPKCQNKISIDEALSHQLSESLKKEFEEKREKEREDERRKMQDWKEKLEKMQTEKAEKEIKDLRLKIKEEQGSELKQLQEELSRQKEEAQKAKENELILRKKANELEDREKNLELELQRKLDNEKEKIREQTSEQFLKEHQLKEAEYKKQAEDMKRKIEELQQKANLTSQQLQGEVLELELEEFLKKEFPLDTIKEVGKGVRGADIMQVVSDPLGREAGVIIWESKRTRDWDEKWVGKLKDDLRATKSDIAILVTSVLPKGLKYFGFKDGIIITCFECLLGVASQARFALIKESQLKNSLVGAQEKKDYVMQYLQSNQFRQRVEAIIEAFKTLKEDLDKEKRMYAASWAKREKQIEQVINNTVGMYGDMQGLMGSSLPQIASLEITTTETLEQVDSKQVYTKETKVVSDNFSQIDMEELR
jgi:hypothetical protein